MAYDDALFQLGMDLTRSSTAQKEDPIETTLVADEDLKQVVERDGSRFAGTHLIVDLFGARRLDDLRHIEKTLKRCVEVAGATLLHIHLHEFTSDGGVSGVAVHDKGHVTIKTWPDRSFAAIDMLVMARSARLRSELVELLESAFAPREVVTNVCKRANGTSRPDARLVPQEPAAAPEIERQPVIARIARAA